MVDWGANGYRLPTEAEWEKGARGGLVGRRLPNGDAFKRGDGNFNNAGTEPVPYSSSNGYGLFDTAGNVSEWCWDYYGADFTSAYNPKGAETGQYRCLRGDSYDGSTTYTRIGARGSNFPNQTGGSVGFRVARAYKVGAPSSIQSTLYPDGRLIASSIGGDSYQWYKDASLINGATLKSLQLSTGSLGAGTYTVKVTNTVGSVTGGIFKYRPTANANNHDIVPIAGTNVAFSRYETTVGQWKAFVAETGWNKSNLWSQVSYNPSDTQPVVAVSRDDVTDYCLWLSNKTGLTWRLPTADEWKTADQNMIYPWGNNFPPSVPDGNFSFAQDGFTNSAPVGSFPPNRIGLYDLAGNVWEWTSDNAANGLGVIKGGDFELTSNEQQILNNSFDLGQGGPHSGVGFRVVCELPADTTTGLLVYYSFQNSLKDASGNGNDLQQDTGISYAKDRFGVDGNALHLQHSNSSAISKNHLGISGNQARTISFWVKVDSDYCTVSSIVGYGDPSINTNPNDLFVSRSNQSIVFQTWGSWQEFTTQEAALDREWNHVTYTHSNLVSGDKFFINGIEVPSIYADHGNGGIWRTTDTNLTIGRFASFQAAPMSIDDVRIYNRALTAKDVAALYNSEKQ
jgi:formylglycine-generating enzyme required for sulfatase activity